MPTEHPRLLGTRAELQALARERAAEYQRMVTVAWQPGADDHAVILSQSLVAAIEADADLGRQAKARAYSTNKLRLFTRQIVFLRPDTVIIFDRVAATNPQFKKTRLLQAMQKPQQQGDRHQAVPDFMREQRRAT